MLLEQSRISTLSIWDQGVVVVQIEYYEIHLQGVNLLRSFHLALASCFLVYKIKCSVGRIQQQTTLPRSWRKRNKKNFLCKMNVISLGR